MDGVREDDRKKKKGKYKQNIRKSLPSRLHTGDDEENTRIKIEVRRYIMEAFLLKILKFMIDYILILILIGLTQSAHFFVASLVCSRAVLFIQLGRKPRSRLELHSTV